ncbi:IclR family transcriptional regulator [Pseudonocardia abyssalis]|uniref:IclR family transcriptional regulator n=1 Tax=Pseudonocardia abyssalis TaxID=2792008 RepID=A0ABS6URL7_9PSEU|nr:IclR family transcriptional regulator [Pseudonocardia abyssalis]MBW0113764.1 IclR family transcriptional regulator [Pseudonocardia abyssalis]MBW0134837.1 IclR family transcriptional regulator [Pseudonocardia abyssalis]
MENREQSDTLSSVNRALTLLELLAENSGLTVTQLADRLRTGKTTAFRLAKTLTERGWVEKDEEMRYRLGPALLSLVPPDQLGQGLRHLLRPLLEELQDATGETVHLTILRGRHVVYVDQLISPKPVHSVSTLGGRSPAHCVSPGLAQLAALPSEALDWVLDAALPPYTERSLTDPGAVRAELQRVRQRGFAINRGAYRAEVGGVGAAVLDDRGRPQAALSVCIPAYRMRNDDLTAIGELLKVKVVDAQQRIRLHRRPLTELP